MEKVKIKIKSMPSVSEGPKSVHIEKLDNGYVISCYGGNEQKKFVKSLVKSGPFLERLLGASGKSAKELDEMTEVEED